MSKREAAPSSRIYAGQREPGKAGPCEVHRFERPGTKGRKLNPRFDLRNHSPDGFQWGYPGSGPSQLALAIVADATGDDELTQRTYQKFKFAKVAGWGASFHITAGEVREFVASLA